MSIFMICGLWRAADADNPTTEVLE